MKVSANELLSQIESALLNSDRNLQMRAVGTALVRIMQNQTQDEVSSESTRYSNGIGFTGAHGQIGTSMAKFFLKNGYLSPRQVKYWVTPMGKLNRPRIMMYRNQLLQFAKQKAKNT